MKIILTALSDEKFAPSRKKLMASVAIGGTDIEPHEHDFEEIRSTAFYNENQHIFKYSKGLGYWLWKPYIIYEELKQAEIGDIIIYSDSEIEITASLTPVLSLTEEQDIVLFGNTSDINLSWVKRDCFVLMDCDTPEYWYSPHCDAAFIVLKKSEKSLHFVEQWLNYCINENILTDLPNVCGEENIEGFIDHRCDQSVLSLLGQKYKLNLYRIPSQFGNFYKMQGFRVFGEFKCRSQYLQTPLDYYAVIPYYNSPYGQLLNHHRTVKKQMVSKTETSLSTEVKRASFRVRLRNRLVSVIYKLLG